MDKINTQTKNPDLTYNSADGFSPGIENTVDVVATLSNIVNRLKKIEGTGNNNQNFSDRTVQQKHIQILNGQNIIVGQANGTKIATSATQKLGFFGKTPIIQVGAISAPNTQGATYSQTDVQSIVTAVNAIRVALTNLGLTA